MPMRDSRILPREAVDSIEAYVDKQLRDAKQYSNSELLDESGVFSLYRLAAGIYALGYEHGEVIAELRCNSRRFREKEKNGSEERSG